ncbi:hypothetical protein BT69DRAFT_220979 [Atractiella rhizophila]|nr:hypothetical protein BT69DRAFT_220979 [Atractiella rhizophila]
MAKKSFKSYALSDVDASSRILDAALLLYCCLSGWVDTIVFSETFVWCGFQTGNTVQLSITFSRLWCSKEICPGSMFPYTDSLALCSLLSFILGSTLAHISLRRPKRRIWLVGATVFQAILLGVSSVLATYSGGELMGGSNDLGVDGKGWTDSYGFVAMAFGSMSMGLQGGVAKRLNTDYAASAFPPLLSANLADLYIESSCRPYHYVGRSHLFAFSL